MDGHLTLCILVESVHGRRPILWLCLEHGCRFQLALTTSQVIPLGSGRPVVVLSTSGSIVIDLQVWQLTLILLISTHMLLLLLLLGDFRDTLADFFELFEVCLVPVQTQVQVHTAEQVAIRQVFHALLPINRDVVVKDPSSRLVQVTVSH